VTERYFAFAPAPGGFLVGNPTLDPERKYEVEWGVDVKKRWFDFSFSLFHSWVDDYILQTQIDRFDVNNDGTPDVVKGFRNVDARLYGFEAGLLLKAGDHWSLPFTAAFVRGKNSSDGRDLPEIPPLELTGAVRADYGIDHPWWVEFGGRFADRQKKVNEAFPEDETGSFAVFHLSGGVTLREALKVELGIENLFDRDYNEHLTREAFLAEGDLEAGDEIPAPGITFYASVRWEF
jgi:iron complex outermembrane receptor protein